MAQTPFEKALADEGIVGTPLESLARSIYMQESSGGKNTKTSNAGAVGGMQILPGTFNEMLPGGNINDAYDNSRAGLRYIKKMNDLAGGDPTLTAAGYYGGPSGMNKAKEGVAVSDPRNPNAPTTLQYAKEVTARQNKTAAVPRETSPAESPAIKENIADLGQNYQAAYALMAMADEEPETTREIEAREAAEEQSAAQQFANMQKQLASIKPASPFAAQGSEEPQNFKEGGEVELEDDDEENKSEARKAFDKYLKKATREESPLDVKFTAPPSQPMVVEGLGVQRGAPPSVQGRVGYDQDGFRMGASGVAVKTPQGVKYMPGMYDVGYRTPMAGGELDMSYARGIKTMPGMKTPQMANVRYVRKFEEGGDVAPVYDKKVSLEKKMANMIGLGPAYEASVQAPKDMGMSGDEGTQGDAVRHMVLMREIEKKYGPTAAKALGYGHEFIVGALAGQTSRNREMDVRNNALGLDLSKEAGTDQEKFNQLVRQSLESKRADYYRDEYKKPVKRAGGSPEMGEVSGSTFEEGGPENAKRMLKDVVRGVSYYPYDLVGAPVDIINMGLKGVDYFTGSKLATEKPVGGSADLIDRSNKLGIAEKPTGSISEEVARFGSAFINPASGARGAGRVLEKTGEIAAKGAEKAGLAATRAITKNPDITAAQMYDAMLSKQGPTTAAVRPKGGVFMGAQSAADAPLVRSDFDIANALEDIDKTTDQGKAIAEFFDKKIRKYVQTQQGTADDPIFKGMLQGRIDPRYIGDPGMWERARAGDERALVEARRRYDSNLGMVNIVPELVAKERGKGYPSSYTREQEKLLKEKIQQQSPGEDTLGVDVRSVNRNSVKEFDNLYDYPGVNQMLDESESGKLLRMLNKTDLPPHIRQAAVQGEPITYQFSRLGGYGNALDITPLRDYLNTRTPAEIKNMGVADVVAKSQEWHRTMAEARKDPNKFSTKQLMEGTEQILPASGNMKWVDVKGSDALSLEGNIMGHCVGGSNYCGAVQRGTTKIISLRDKKGFPHVTIELTANDKGVFDKIGQVKGTANNSPEKYFKQIDEFLTDYSAKLGEPLRITERPSYLPEKWRK